MSATIVVTNMTSTSEYELPKSVDAMIIGLLNALIFVIGLVGNTMVILAVLLSKKLQTASNTFIVNLAVADLLTCLVMPLFTTAQWVRYYSSSLEGLCRVATGVVHTCIGGSIFTLAAIALNRYILIWSPHRIYRKVYTPKVLFVWITLIWLITISLSILPPLAFDVGKLGFDVSFHTCVSLRDYHSSKLYENLLVFGFYPLPLLIITISYVGIFIRITKHTRRLNKSRDNLTTAAPDKMGRLDMESRDDDDVSRPKITPLQIQVTKNMFFIFCAFLICLTPHSICTLFGCAIERYTRCIVAFNSMVNPFIYGFNHPIFRQVFTSFFKCRSIPEPSSFLTNLNRRINDFRSSSS